MRPSLAVVVPTLNEERLLPRLLARLGTPVGGTPAAREPAPADAPDEVVVVDGGSLDGTQELVRAAPGVRLCLHEPACRGAQLARGAAETSAELVLFLHADCLPDAGALEQLRAAFADPDVLATGLAQQLDGSGPFYRALERWRTARITRGSVYGDSGLCLRSTLYRELGGHRPWPLFEDLDLSKRIARRGRIARVPHAVLHVDTRRWRRLGPLRTTIRNRMLYLGYRLGVSPERLARSYAAATRRGVHEDATPSRPESERP